MPDSAGGCIFLVYQGVGDLECPLMTLSALGREGEGETLLTVRK